jgi:hypothetical protein
MSIRFFFEKLIQTEITNTHKGLWLGTFNVKSVIK